MRWRRSCSNAETGPQQSDRAEDRGDLQVQHIEIKEVPRSSALTDDAEKRKRCARSEEHTHTRRQHRTREAHKPSGSQTIALAGVGKHLVDSCET